jgi:hypothetical protein
MKAPAISKQEHRVNEIEARKTWVKTVQMFCNAMRERISKSANGAR